MKFLAHRRGARRGFSLLEMLVVVGIFSTISLVVLANHSRFNSSALLGNLAYNIALSIREAQVYGLSVQQYENDFSTGYGVHVDVGDNTRYVFFADNNANNEFDAGDSVIKQYAVQRAHEILKFCGVKSTGIEECSDGSTATTITFLDIVFFRPNPDAKIHSDYSNDYSAAKISVASSAGEVRTVSVASTGQIAVNPESTYTGFSNCTPTSVCSGGQLRNSCTNQLIQTCTYGCDSGSNSCNACTPTPPNSCSGNNVVNNCGTILQACQEPASCVSGSCCVSSNTCSGGNVVNSCTGALVQSCTYGCTSGSCNACTPNSTQCSGNTAQTCNSSGQWVNTATCPYVCSGGSCTGSCVPGSVQCSGSNAQTCTSGGSWSTTQSCAYGCTGGSCNACTPSNTCSGGNVVNSCTGALVQSCTYGCTSGSCNACTPSNVCSGSNLVNSCTGAVVQACAYGCSNGVCNSCVPTYTCQSGNITDSCSGAIVEYCDYGCTTGAGYCRACTGWQCGGGGDIQ